MEWQRQGRNACMREGGSRNHQGNGAMGKEGDGRMKCSFVNAASRSVLLISGSINFAAGYGQRTFGL